MAVKPKNQAAVELGRAGGKKGGPARASKLTSAERSESARKAVLARWAKAKKNGGSTVASAGRTRNGRGANKARVSGDDISRKRLLRCLDRLKNAQDENKIRRLTEELQRIVFHKQYENAAN